MLYYLFKVLRITKKALPHKQRRENHDESTHISLLRIPKMRENKRKSPQFRINYSSPADLRHNISALISRAINVGPRRLSGAYLRVRVLDTLWLCSDVDWMAMVALWGWELEVLIAVVMGILLMILCLGHCKSIPTLRRCQSKFQLFQCLWQSTVSSNKPFRYK